MVSGLRGLICKQGMHVVNPENTKPHVFHYKGITIFISEGEPGAGKTTDCCEFLIPLAEPCWLCVEHQRAKIETDKFLYLAIQVEEPGLSQAWKLLYSSPFPLSVKQKRYMLTEDALHVVHLFVNEFTNRHAGHEFVLQNLQEQLLVMLLRCIQKYDVPNTKTVPHSAVYSAMQFLHDNYHLPFCLKDAANAANLSQYHFIRIFKSTTGKTPYEYYIDIKLDKAKKLLESTAYSITDICHMVGFSNSSHFANVFKKKTGIMPSAYRKYHIEK